MYFFRFCMRKPENGMGKSRGALPTARPLLLQLELGCHHLFWSTVLVAFIAFFLLGKLRFLWAKVYFLNLLSLAFRMHCCAGDQGKSWLWLGKYPLRALSPALTMWTRALVNCWQLSLPDGSWPLLFYYEQPIIFPAPSFCMNLFQAWGPLILHMPFSCVPAPLST